MKRKAAIGIVIIVLACIGYLGQSIYSRIQERKTLRQRLAKLPEVELPVVGEEAHSSWDANDSTALVLTYFDTECPYCRAEIRSIQQSDLPNVATVMLVSDQPLDELHEFMEEFQLQESSPIKVVQDSGGAIKRLFGVKGVPSTYLYGPDRKLKSYFKGKTSGRKLYHLAVQQQ